MSKLALVLGRFVNRILRPFGIRIQPYNPNKPPVRKIHYWRFERILFEYYDYLHKSAFPEIPEVKNRVELLGKLEGQNIREAMWILAELYKAIDVDGDVCEFGCAAGATSALLANEIRLTPKRLWLFDSFEGLSKPTEKDELIDDLWELGSIEAYEGKMKYSSDSVVAKMQEISFPLSRVEIVPGFIEETIRSSPLPESVCFALVDFDFYEPIRIALDYLSEHISLGGRIVVDDYGFFSLGAKVAVDEFVTGHAESFSLELSPEWAGHFATLTRLK